MPTPAATALDNTDEQATTALYRAAIGEVNSDYYLPLFERFEAANRAHLSWNGAAALYTLPWLAFRQLWHGALVYAGVLVLLALGIFGIGRLVFQFSDTTQWALLAGMFLLSVLVPGLGGNALLFSATRKRMEVALKATSTVAEACALLGRKSPTRKGLIAQMLANGMSVALLAYAWLQFAGWMPDAIGVSVPVDTRNVAVGRTTDAVAPTVVPPIPAASAPMAIASAPAPSLAASEPQLAASGPVTGASAPLPPASAPVTAASSAAPALVAPQVAASAPVPPQTQPTRTPTKPQAPPRTAPTPPGASKATPTTPPSAPNKIILLSKPIAVDTTADRASTTTPTAEESAAPLPSGYVVLVGLFVLENNARNAYTQILDAELPAQSQRIRTPQGLRTRVSVGPFESQAEADRAVDKIRAMGLNAQVAPR
ncbi:MAG: SPOR domain-containing protein [Rhodoferax sp.]